MSRSHLVAPSRRRRRSVARGLSPSWPSPVTLLTRSRIARKAACPNGGAASTARPRRRDARSAVTVGRSTHSYASSSGHSFLMRAHSHQTCRAAPAPKSSERASWRATCAASADAEGRGDALQREASGAAGRRTSSSFPIRAGSRQFQEPARRMITPPDPPECSGASSAFAPTPPAPRVDLSGRPRLSSILIG